MVLLEPLDGPGIAGPRIDMKATLLIDPQRCDPTRYRCIFMTVPYSVVGTDRRDSIHGSSETGAPMEFAPLY
jgi:hypothetical protein